MCYPKPMYDTMYKCIDICIDMCIDVYYIVLMCTDVFSFTGVY